MMNDIVGVKAQIYTHNPNFGGVLLETREFPSARWARDFARRLEKKRGAKPFSYWVRLIPLYNDGSKGLAVSL